MKIIKHLLGWLFRYCPYGGDCPPKHPFKKREHSQELDGGGGCGSGHRGMMAGTGGC